MIRLKMGCLRNVEGRQRDRGEEGENHGHGSTRVGVDVVVVRYVMI